MIELSTLTGACAVALGYTYSAIFSNSDKLANKLIETGNKYYLILYILSNFKLIAIYLN